MVLDVVCYIVVPIFVCYGVRWLVKIVSGWDD